MVSLIKISSFTPVESENPLTLYPALYLSPLFQNREIAVVTQPVQLAANGSKGCTTKHLETSVLSTACKIFTYIISAGILPLFAILFQLAIRACHKFHYIRQSSLPTHPVDDTSKRQRLLRQQTERIEVAYKEENEKIQATYEESVQKEKARYEAEMAQLEKKKAEVQKAAAAVETLDTLNRNSPLPGTIIFSKKCHVLSNDTYTNLQVSINHNKIQAKLTSFLCGRPLGVLLQHEQIVWETQPTSENIQNLDHWFVDKGKVIFRAKNPAFPSC